jgi:hypothetical protein
MRTQQLIRRLNVVFRDWNLPKQETFEACFKQAEKNYWLKGKDFVAACERAMSHEQIEKDNAILKSAGA